MNEFLAALMLFNSTVLRYRASAIPEVRVFVGAQPGEGGQEKAWTKCVPESRVYVVQVAQKTLTLGDEKIIFAGAHEVCHLILHRKLLCDEKYSDLLRVRKQEIELQADACAAQLLAGDRAFP